MGDLKIALRGGVTWTPAERGGLGVFSTNNPPPPHI